MPDGGGTFIYFVKPVGLDGPIKIGCSMYPGRRLKAFMDWSPFELEIIVSFPGTRALEANIHDCFAKLQFRGEWFHAAPRLLSAVEKLKAGVPIAEAIDLSAREGNLRKSRGSRVRASKEYRLYCSYRHRINWAMSRAEKEIGERVISPSDVSEIMERWQNWSRDRDHGCYVMPPPESMARLDRVIADPVANCRRLSQLRAA